MTRLFYTDIDLQGANRIRNVPSPVDPGDAASKAYVDSAVEGLSWKASCRVATQSNINLTAPGSVIDTITLANGDRVLVSLQSNGTENGIYIWNGPSAAMTRSLDANTFKELEQAVVTVEEGSSAGVSYRQTAINGTLGTTAIDWTPYGTAAPQASTSQSGISQHATQAEVDSGQALTPNKVVTPDTLANWAGRRRRVAATIGDGSATSFAINHNFGTYDVSIEAFLNSGTRDTIEADYQRTSLNAVTIVFGTVPAADSIRVLVSE